MSPSLVPFDLRCEYAVQPLGIDVAQPRFAWLVANEHAAASERGGRQSAYRLLVASSAELLQQSIGDLWDSGWVESDAMQATYDGAPLTSRTRFWWNVQMQEGDGKSSSPSEATWFETAFLSPNEWQAQWIGAPDFGAGAPLFRREFVLNGEVREARAYVCGLGYLELRINGNKVGNDALGIAWTEERSRALYATYDVTEMLRQGPNAVGVLLGNGWYGSDYYQRPIAILPMILEVHVTLVDDSNVVILSGPQGWRVLRNAAITENSIYNGETLDARLAVPGWDMPGFNVETPAPSGDEWKRPLLLATPTRRLKAQALEPIQVVQTLEPVGVSRLDAHRSVYDLGQNFAGWVRIVVAGKRGDRVTLRHAELVHPDGTINPATLRSARATDAFVLGGDGVETYEPRFTFHGFRYVQVEVEAVEAGGDLPVVTGLVGCHVRSAVATIGSFESSNALLNQIQKNAVWTESSNLMGLPTDCPQRDERLGWLNDMTVRSEAAVYNFDLARLYAKWEQDIADTQDASGAVGDTAPFRLGRRPADPVCASVLLVPWNCYLHYGNRRILDEHYGTMRAWVDYLLRQAENGIVRFFSYADWASPIEYCVRDSIGSGALSAITPPPLVSTAFTYFQASLLARIAEVLGNAVDAQDYREHAAVISAAFNREFWDESRQWYGTGSQAAQALALHFGLAQGVQSEAALNRLLHDVVYEKQIHLSTGNLCSRYVLDVLCDHGHADVAFALATQESYPSWGHTIANGATTIWERWEHVTSAEESGMNSHNHPMYGSITGWFYSRLAGIRPLASGPGFSRFEVRPSFPRGLAHVAASVETPRGRVSVAWQQNVDTLVLNLTVPFSSTAEFHLPKLGPGHFALTEGETLLLSEGNVTGSTQGVRVIEQSESGVFLEVSSGTYEFRVRWA